MSPHTPPLTNQSPEAGIPSNISKIYLFSYFWMALIILPIFVPYLLDLGLSMAEILKLQAFYGICVMLFEVPTGYVSDILNRKASLVIGSFISAVGFSFLPWITEYWQLMVYEGALAFGYTLVSGTDLAIFYDSLPLKSERAESTRGIARIKSAHVFSEAVASIVSGFLIMVSFTAVIWAQVIVAWIPFFITLGLKEPIRHKMDGHTHIENFKGVFKHMFASTSLMRLISINYIFWGLATFFAVWTYQKFWLVEGISLTHFGWVWAVMHILVGLVAQRVHTWEKRFGPVLLLWLLCLLPPAGYILMSVLNSWWAVSMCLLFSVSRGITQVLMSDAFNWRIPNASRATANSIVSMLFRTSFALFAPLMGYSIDQMGVRFTYTILGVVFGIGAIVVMWPLIIKVRKLSIDEIPHKP